MMLVDLSGPTVIHNPPASPGAPSPPYTNADLLTPVMERGAKKASWAPPHPAPPGGSMTPSGTIRPTLVQDTTLLWIFYVVCISVNIRGFPNMVARLLFLRNL